MTGEHEFGEAGGSYDVPPNGSSGFTAPPKHYYELLSIAALLAMTSPPWIVRRVIRAGELVVFYGEPSCFKTFVVIDLILRIAFGFDWCGYKTKRGAVVYLAGEGKGGFGRRLQAWATLLPKGVALEDAPVRILPEALAFMSQPDFDGLLAALSRENEKPLVIVVDTLNRYMVGGDENSAKDMGVFIDRCCQLRGTTGAVIIIVHHKGKNATSERGSSALRGAADVMIEVVRDNLNVELRGDKAKDAELLKPVHMTARSVWLANDEDGETVTSLVLDPREPPAESAEQTAKKDPGAAIRSTLATVFAGEASPSALHGASGLGRTRFYDTLKEELKAKRIERVGTVQRPIYRLTPTAPEYVRPRPRPEDSANGQTDAAGNARPSASASTTPPKGVDARTDGQRAASSPHPEQTAEGDCAAPGARSAGEAAAGAPPSEPEGGWPPESDAPRGDA